MSNKAYAVICEEQMLAFFKGKAGDVQAIIGTWPTRDGAEHHVELIDASPLRCWSNHYVVEVSGA